MAVVRNLLERTYSATDSSEILVHSDRLDDDIQLAQIRQLRQSDGFGRRKGREGSEKERKRSALRSYQIQG